MFVIELYIYTTRGLSGLTGYVSTKWRKRSTYQFNSLCFEPIGERTHELPQSRRERYYKAKKINAQLALNANQSLTRLVFTFNNKKGGMRSGN